MDATDSNRVSARHLAYSRYYRTSSRPTDDRDVQHNAEQLYINPHLQSETLKRLRSKQSEREAISRWGYSSPASRSDQTPRGTGHSVNVAVFIHTLAALRRFSKRNSPGEGKSAMFALEGT